MEGLGFGVQGFGVEASVPLAETDGSSSNKSEAFPVEGLGFRVDGLGFRVQVSGFRFQGLRF